MQIILVYLIKKYNLYSNYRFSFNLVILIILIYFKYLLIKNILFFINIDIYKNFLSEIFFINLYDVEIIDIILKIN